MVLLDVVGLVALGEFARGPQEVKRPAGVAVFLGGEGRTQRDDVVRERVALERDVGPGLEDVAQLVGVVGREDDLLLAEAGLDTGSKKSVNFRSFEMPMIETREFSSSEFIRERL